MEHAPHPQPDRPLPAVYQIRVAGRLDPAWSDWLPGLAFTTEAGGDTLLTGPVADQAALHGLLRAVRDLGVTLVSVNRVEASPIPAPRVEGEGR